MRRAKKAIGELSACCDGHFPKCQRC
jgi:hypothetical protein